MQPSCTVPRMPGLDVLRGFAVGLVLLRHALPGVFGGAGIVGVVIFFTLSGYLITSILLRETREVGRMDYPRFYRNRALRLMPALLLVVTAFTVVELLTNLLGARDELVPTVLLALSYTSDLPLPWQINPALDHLWTLAVEEQFYLIWPFLVAGAVRRRRLRSLLVVTSLALVIFSGGSVLLMGPDGFGAVYSWPTTWSVALVIGAAGAACCERLAPGGGGAVRCAALVALVSLCALALLPGARGVMAFYLIGAPTIGLCSLLLIHVLCAWDRTPVALRPLGVLGRISYGVYLWNLLIVQWLATSLDHVLVALLSIPLTLLAAAASWRWVEKPALRLKRAHDRPRPAPAEQRSPVRVPSPRAARTPDEGMRAPLRGASES